MDFTAPSLVPNHFGFGTHTLGERFRWRLPLFSFRITLEIGSAEAELGSHDTLRPRHCGRKKVRLKRVPVLWDWDSGLDLGFWILALGFGLLAFGFRNSFVPGISLVLSVDAGNV